MSREALEQTETLRDEVLVSLRRLGCGRVHFALVMPETVTEGEHWGAPCTFIAPPVVAFCRAKLRGRLVAIHEEHFDSWRRGGKVCSACQAVARLALAQVEDLS